MLRDVPGGSRVQRESLLQGARTSTMRELAAWTLWADRVLTW